MRGTDADGSNAHQQNGCIEALKDARSHMDALRGIDVVHIVQGDAPVAVCIAGAPL